MSKEKTTGACGECPEKVPLTGTFETYDRLPIYKNLGRPKKVELFKKEKPLPLYKGDCKCDC